MPARTAIARITVLATIFGAVISVSAGLAQGYTDPNAAVDPPGRVARISVLQGEVSLEPAGANAFAQAELNYPLTIGDRVYADLQALSELETAGLAVRMSNGADVTLVNLTDAVAQLGLAQGSIRVSTRETPAPDGSSGVVEIDTPNGTIWVQAPGDIRIDTYPQNNTTVVTVTSGQVEVAGPNLDQTLGPNEAVQLAGANPVSARFVGAAAPDALDEFDQSRENQFQSTIAQESEYVSPDMIGGEDLASYGSWTADPDYGTVWYPRGVAIDWVPYHNGRWVYIQPWGWTWVESEPWGFAPFHYGRWVNRENRWGWIPGPPPRLFPRPVRPVYSPALVAFVGGRGFGVTAWFPLGPGEAYVPSYATTTAYVNRVNVTNIYNRNPAQVRAGLSNRTANLYGGDDRNRVYANRSMGTTAVNQNDFEAGRHVMRSQPVRIDSNMRQQLSQAPVAARPAATPTATVVQVPARALPPVQARPQLPARATGEHGTMQAPINRNVPGADRSVAPAQGAPQQRYSAPPPNTPQPRNYAPPAATPERRNDQPPAAAPQPPANPSQPRGNQPAPVVTTPAQRPDPAQKTVDSESNRPRDMQRQPEVDLRQELQQQRQREQLQQQQPAQPQRQQPAPQSQPAQPQQQAPRQAEPDLRQREMQQLQQQQQRQQQEQQQRQQQQPQRQQPAPQPQSVPQPAPHPAAPPAKPAETPKKDPAKP